MFILVVAVCVVILVSSAAAAHSSAMPRHSGKRVVRGTVSVLVAVVAAAAMAVATPCFGACDCSWYSVNCSNRDLTEVPPSISGSRFFMLCVVRRNDGSFSSVFVCLWVHKRCCLR